MLEDLPEILGLLAHDPLGGSGETRAAESSLRPYPDAFGAIDADSAQLLIVVTATREAVRVRADYRSQGLGHAMFEWAIGEARRHGCALVQLTTDKTRTDAHRFYDSLGFVSSHEGLKLDL